jgi:hypothetical protein
MKIPDPIIVPTTMAIAPRVPIARGSSVGAWEAAFETREPGDDDFEGVAIVNLNAKFQSSVPKPAVFLTNY